MNRSIALVTALLAGATVVQASAPAHATARGEQGRIAFRRYVNADHTRGDIFTITAKGTRERRVTHARRTQLATEPDWSPNGRWIGYQVARDGDLDRSRLYKIHPDGTHRTFIDASCQAPCQSDGFAQWAPHSRRIAFQRELGTATDPAHLVALYVMRADGTHVRRLTQRGTRIRGDHRFQDRGPTWSPTGRRIAFERQDNSTGRHAIWTVRLDGTHYRRITPWQLDAAQPDWSPDGRWILLRSDEESDESGNEWLVHPDGTRLHRVTHTAPGAGKWGSSSFAPNGRKIVASHSPGVGTAGNADVYVMRLDGTHRHNITSSASFESAPDWGPRPRL
jgi:TolB protein